MKKILSALTLLLTLLVVACGPTAPQYDNDANKDSVALKASLLKQATKEGFSEEEAIRIVGEFLVKLEDEKDAEIKKHFGTEEPDPKEFAHYVVDKYMQGKTIAEMKAYKSNK